MRKLGILIILLGFLSMAGCMFITSRDADIDPINKKQPLPDDVKVKKVCGPSGCY